MTMTQLRTPARETPVPIQTDRRAIPTAGLCTTCDEFPTCVLRSNAGRAVWDCSEYSDGPTAALSPRSLPRTSDVVAVEDALGLCINCDLVAKCALRTPGQAVLRCEEYR